MNIEPIQRMAVPAKRFVAFLVCALLASGAAFADGFDLANWKSQYAKAMGNPKTMELHESQGGVHFVLQRDGQKFHETLSDGSDKLLATVDFDNGEVTSHRADGHSGVLSVDQQSEFVTESALMTNDLGAAEITDLGPVPKINSLEKLRAIISHGAPVDLWVDTATGELKAAFVVLSTHAVILRPIAVGTIPAGPKFFGIWQRDHEDQIEVTHAVVGK